MPIPLKGRVTIPPMRLAWLALLASCFLLLAGCGPEMQHIGGKDRPKEYRAIVSLSPSLTELIGQYGDMTRLVGRTAADNYPLFLSSNPKLQVVVSGVKPNYEKIRSLNPDLVVYDKSLYNEDDVAKLKDLGVELFEFDADTLDDFIRELYRLAKTVGGELQMSEYVDKINAARSAATELTGGRKPKTAVLMGGDGGEFMILGKDSFQAEVLTISGAEVVGPASDEFVPLNAEALVGWNPEVILIASEAAMKQWAEMAPTQSLKDQRTGAVLAPRVAPEALLRDARLASTTAIQKKQIASLNPDVILRKGARVDRLIDGVSRFISGLPQE